MLNFLLKVLADVLNQGLPVQGFRLRHGLQSIHIRAQGDTFGFPCIHALLHPLLKILADVSHNGLGVRGCRHVFRH